MSSRLKPYGPIALVLITLVSLRTLPAGAQQAASRDVKRSFLAEQGSPLNAIQQNGSVLVLRNVSEKDIINWGEVCLGQNGGGYKVLKVFTLDEVSPIKSGVNGFDVFGIDATPIVLCRKAGGLLAISEVHFADGSSWTSRWLATTSREPH
jgi:hypothetical protein